MANKITQLVNESGDNLYPLAGGMAADSITTAMLKDASVTSDKIDYTTLGATLSFPNTHVSQAATNPLTILKFGKIIFIQGGVSLSGYSTYTDVLSSDINNAVSIPEGFRPYKDVHIICQASGNTLCRVYISTNGLIALARCRSANTPTDDPLYLQNNPTIRINACYLAA